MTVQEEKKALRRTMRAIEGQLSRRYAEDSGGRIVRALLALPEYRYAGTVCAFVGTGREINTTPLLENALAQGKRLCVPRVLDQGRMEMRYVESLSQLSPGVLGIPEPGEDSAECGEIDFAVIPCLSCSYQGRRLGRGGGYYDRFLASFQGSAVLVCREKLIRQEIPVEPHDMPVPYVLTERALYEDGIPTPIG